jgi:hypothetical protein
MNGLAGSYAISLIAISRHIKGLETAGLIRRRVDRKAPGAALRHGIAAILPSSAMPVTSSE